ncbi:MAG TPA: pyridoxal-5'-phosphate-dependent protein, partial [Pseudonocardiaceae bacterium]|nr:pyridoxal-5'-phosphate-dependent protein [Pseudonocardiaceae bacterium]
MLVELDPATDRATATALADRLAVHEDVLAWPIRLRGRSFVVVSGDESLVPEVDSASVIGRHGTQKPGYWLVAKDNGVAPEQVRIGSSVVGGDGLWCAAGPCALEDVGDAKETASAVAGQGADAVRMGLFKPRSSPYHFLGKQRAGLAALAEVRASCGRPVVTEVLDPRDVDAVAEVADCLQVDTRNMTNRALLAELGRIDRPVLLMRGLRSTVTEWLRAAEFLFAHGNPDVVLCARGIVSFDDSLAFQPDFGAISELRRRTELPVVFDPSHSTGRADAVGPAALAAVAFGADGLLVEA